MRGVLFLVKENPNIFLNMFIELYSLTYMCD